MPVVVAVAVRLMVEVARSVALAVAVAVVVAREWAVAVAVALSVEFVRNGIMPHLWGINLSHIYAREVR